MLPLDPIGLKPPAVECLAPCASCDAVGAQLIEAKSFMRKLIQNQGNGVWWANAIREYLARTGETAADPKVSG